MNPYKPPIKEILATKDRKERRRLVNAWFNNYMENRDRLSKQKVVIANEDEDFWQYYNDEMSALFPDTVLEE